MRILGIDPGYGIVGYGIIDTDDGLRAVDYGVINTPKEEAMPARLAIIFASKQLLKSFNQTKSRLKNCSFSEITQLQFLSHKHAVSLFLLAPCFAEIFLNILRFKSSKQ